MPHVHSASLGEKLYRVCRGIPEPFWQMRRLVPAWHAHRRGDVYTMPCHLQRVQRQRDQLHRVCLRLCPS